jgi:transcription elongation factor Elf1
MGDQRKPRSLAPGSTIQKLVGKVVSRLQSRPDIPLAENRRQAVGSSSLAPRAPNAEYVAEISCPTKLRRFTIRVVRDADGWLVTGLSDTPSGGTGRFGVAGLQPIAAAVGQTRVSPNYSGCPFCGSHSLFICDCGGISCLGDSQVVRCPYCGQASMAIIPATSIPLTADHTGVAMTRRRRELGASSPAQHLPGPNFKGLPPRRK